MRLGLTEFFCRGICARLSDSVIAYGALLEKGWFWQIKTWMFVFWSASTFGTPGFWDWASDIHLLFSEDRFLAWRICCLRGLAEVQPWTTFLYTLSPIDMSLSWKGKMKLQERVLVAVVLCAASELLFSYESGIHFLYSMILFCFQFSSSNLLCFHCSNLL